MLYLKKTYVLHTDFSSLDFYILVVSPVPWFPGSLVLWSPGSLVPWFISKLTNRQTAKLDSCTAHIQGVPLTMTVAIRLKGRLCCLKKFAAFY